MGGRGRCNELHIAKGENSAAGGLGWVSGFIRSHEYQVIELGFESKSIKCQSHGLLPTLASPGRGQIEDTAGGSRGDPKAFFA